MSKIAPLLNKFRFSNDSDDDDDVDELLQAAIGEPEAKEENIGEALAESKIMSFGKQRVAMKERIVKDVLDVILPDMSDYDDVDDLMYVKEEKKTGPMKQFLKVLGCWSMSVHEAVILGSVEFVERSIRQVVRSGRILTPEAIDEYDKNGMTALSVAVKAKRADVVEVILRNKAKPNLADLGTGIPPLSMALSNNSNDIALLLINYGANVHLCDFRCVFPIMIACARDNARMVQLLVDGPLLAATSVVDENGWTPLHYAAHGNSPDCCKIIMLEGADRHVKDYHHRKAIDMARYKDHGNCIAVLEDLKSRLDHECPW